MSLRRNRLVIALCMALTGTSLVPASGTPSTQAQMEQLIRFLSQRVQEEDPAASPEAIRGALYESLEMMGVAVSPAIRDRGDMSPTELASALMAPAPGSGAARAVGPTGTRRPNDDIFMVESDGPGTALPPAGAVAPKPAPAVASGSAPRASTPLSAAQVDELMEAFPQIGSFVPPRRAPDTPGVAEIARTLMNPAAPNPWKPALKPVGMAPAVRLPATATGPEAIAPTPAASPGSQGVDGSSRVAELLRQMRQKRRGTQLTPDADL